jgi:acyl carrier protein
MAYEEEFGIEIADDEAAQAVTVADAVRLIDSKVQP